MARSMELSSWPARPTKGSPWRSSSAPGASPTMSHCACMLPTPNTVCVRVVLSEQRVQAATRARSSGQSTPASRPSPGWGDTADSRLLVPIAGSRRSRVSGRSRNIGASRGSRTSVGAALSRAAAAFPRTAQASRPSADRYWWRNSVFMRE